MHLNGQRLVNLVNYSYLGMSKGIPRDYGGCEQRTFVGWEELYWEGKQFLPPVMVLHLA